jgi:prevent-host-death family protein
MTKARVNFGSVMRRVRLKKERFVIEKDGYPVAVLMDIDEYEDLLDATDEGLKRDIAISTAEFKAGKGRPVEELIAKLEKKVKKER